MARCPTLSIQCFWRACRRSFSLHIMGSLHMVLEYRKPRFNTLNSIYDSFFNYQHQGNYKTSFIYMFFSLCQFLSLYHIQGLNNDMSNRVASIRRRVKFLSDKRAHNKKLLLKFPQIVLGENQLWHMDREKSVIWSNSILSSAQEPLRGDTCRWAGQVFHCHSSQRRILCHLC